MMQRFMSLQHLVKQSTIFINNMKKLAYFIFSAALIITAALNVSAQSEMTRSVSGFNKLASSGPFNVHVKIDGTESLKISASQGIINEIETVVEDGKLEIKFKHHYEWNHDNIGKVDVYVTAKSLSSIINAGSGTIKVDGTITGGDASVTLSGSGSVESAIKSGTLHATLSGSGAIRLTGRVAGETKITLSGSGEVNAKQLKTETASVLITGSGNAYFEAEKSISAHIVGSGNVLYTGNPTVNSGFTVGSGKVSKAD